MHLIVFVTVPEEDSSLEQATGPLLLVEDRPGVPLPYHPRGMHWRYAATMPLEDQLFEAERLDIELALSEGGTYVWQRLLIGERTGTGRVAPALGRSPTRPSLSRSGQSVLDDSER